MRKVPSSSADISAFDRNIISAKYIIRRICGSPAHWYGLENSSVIFDAVVRKAHDDEARYVEDSIIGGDTAVFRPVSADDEEDDDTEENED